MSKKQAVNGRVSARKKTETVLRLLRGEDLHALPQEVRITAVKLSKWHETFVRAKAQA